MNYDVILVDIMQDIVSKTGTVLGMEINYEPGRSIQILNSLNELDNSTTMKGLKYPLFAMLLPIKEKRGTGPGYASVTIPRIIFATITKSGEGTERVLDKYASDGTFKTILYPLYKEFLNQCGKSGNLIGPDPDAIVHTKMDNPGQQPIGQGSTDYIDSIEILDLELYLNQIKTCK